MATFSIILYNIGYWRFIGDFRFAAVCSCASSAGAAHQASAAEQQRVKREHDEQRGRQGTCDQRGQVQVVSGAASEGLGGRGEGM